MIVLQFQNCSTKKNDIFWVSGFKTECTAGAGKMKCLNVHKGENLENPKWENFYSNIEGFQFEKGFLKKIKIKEEKIDNPPADDSSNKYILVKELEKKLDLRVSLVNNWILNSINNNPINRSIILPELEINLYNRRVTGISGCNNYSGQINKLSSNTIQFPNIISTKKACINKNIEQDYLNALRSVAAYQIKEENLILFDKDGKRILSYLKKVKQPANQRLNDIWIATSIMGGPINRMNSNPRLEINLNEMKIFGNDGCNDYIGGIKEISDTQINFGNILGTQKMCRNMETVDKYNKVMMTVASYKLDALKLILLNKKGEEILTFLKGD